jgi:hypothetical protein
VGRPAGFHQQTKIQTSRAAADANDVHANLPIYFEIKYFKIEVNVREKSEPVKPDKYGLMGVENPSMPPLRIGKELRLPFIFCPQLVIRDGHLCNLLGDQPIYQQCVLLHQQLDFEGGVLAPIFT